MYLEMCGKYSKILFEGFNVCLINDDSFGEFDTNWTINVNGFSRSNTFSYRGI